MLAQILHHWQRWLLLLSLCFEGCYRPPMPKEATSPLIVLPWEDIAATSSLLPEITATSSNTPEDVKRFPFAFPPGFHEARLFLYDDATKDVWIYPGAGEGIANVGEINPGQYYFDSHGSIFVYIIATECLMMPIETHSAVRFAFLPTYDAHYNLYFIGTNDPEEASRSVGHLFAAFTPFGPEAPTTSRLGPPCTLFELSKVNALEGCITSVSVTMEGNLLAFTTECGEIYLYTPFEPTLLRLSIDPYRAANVSIDPIWGRYIAWKDLKGNWIYILDRWTGCIRPVPINELFGVSMIGYVDGDPWHVFFFGTVPGAPWPSLFAYDWRTQSVRSLTILNEIQELFCVNKGTHLE